MYWPFFWLRRLPVPPGVGFRPTRASTALVEFNCSLSLAQKTNQNKELNGSTSVIKCLLGRPKALPFYCVAFVAFTCFICILRIWSDFFGNTENAVESPRYIIFPKLLDVKPQCDLVSKRREWKRGYASDRGQPWNILFGNALCIQSL